MDILIEESEGSLWSGVLSNGRLEGLEVDPAHEEVRWGSIYHAKVKTIDKALDAVFVDLDGDNTGILYNKDVRIKGKDGKYTKGGATAIGKTFSPGDMIAVQAKTAYLPDITSQHGQVERKIPQMSMDITLPGRYLIYCATLDKNRISVRITDKKMRSQLKEMMLGLKDVQGCILRAAAANTQTDILHREAKILKAAWEEVEGFMEGNEPNLIMLGPDAIQRVLSDNADKTIDNIEVVTMEHYTYIEEWCSVFAPDLVPKIAPIELEDAHIDLALFHYRDIIGQIENLFTPYHFLPSGGNIIIQTTAALTAIDVNKSSDTRSNLDVNIEAAKESLRQLRLRNGGGVVLIDFLKCKTKTEADKLLRALNIEAAKDPCTVQIHGFTGTGLIELSRKRRTPPLNQRMDVEDL